MDKQEYIQAVKDSLTKDFGLNIDESDKLIKRSLLGKYLDLYPDRQKEFTPRTMAEVLIILREVEKRK